MSPTTTKILSALLLLAPVLTPTSATPTPNTDVTPREPGLVGNILNLSVVDQLLALGASAPPSIIRNPVQSPECAAVNQGELQCCQATVAGDLPLIVWLAELYGYALNPNDINGLMCDNNTDTCPGVKVCCQVALTPLLSLWCQSPY